MTDKLPHDIRFILLHADGPSPELDRAICKALGNKTLPRPYSTDYTSAVEFIQNQDLDWVMGSVNGRCPGGTPYAHVGVPEDHASYAASPLLSLWLSYFRFKLGDERAFPEAGYPL